MDGEKRTAPSGMQLVKIGDTWYYNDSGDFVTYLKEYKEYDLQLPVRTATTRYSEFGDRVTSRGNRLGGS